MSLWRAVSVCMILLAGSLMALDRLGGDGVLGHYAQTAALIGIAAALLSLQEEK